MPPKGWKKDAQNPSPAATPAPTKKAVAKAPAKQHLEKRAAKSEEVVGKILRAPDVEDKTFNQVAAVLGTLASQRGNLAGLPTTSDQAVVNAALDKAIINAVEHLDRLRASLPMGVDYEQAAKAEPELIEKTASKADQKPTPRQAGPAPSPVPMPGGSPGAPFTPAGFVPAVGAQAS